MTELGLNRLLVDVEATGDALLVIGELFLPGWRATVDGTPAPLIRADAIFRGVRVPGGRHQVELRYFTPDSGRGSTSRRERSGSSGSCLLDHWGDRWGRRSGAIAFGEARPGGDGEREARQAACFGGVHLVEGARGHPHLQRAREHGASSSPRILAQDPRLEVLVVDDGSPDGTGRARRRAWRADEPRVHVLHRAGKLGLGSAYLAGFRWALERDYDARVRDGRRLLA